MLAISMEKKLAASLKGFCSANYDSIISRGEEEIRSYERRITDTFDQIRQYRSKLDDAQIRLEAIRNRALLYRRRRGSYCKLSEGE